MPWNFHHYYTSQTDGLIGKLLLTVQEKNELKALRQKVRLRTKDVFEEAKKIARDVKYTQFTEDRIKEELANSKLKYLSEEEQRKISRLIFNMDDDSREEFLNLTPRFWTQGSFQYDTLNRPFQPGQEVDIDDGTYMPMTIFESEPKIGHTLLLLLVDSSLKSLEADNDGWVFEAKQTCGRIKIPYKKIHIDVPMYAIPKDQFFQKELAKAVSLNRNMACESYDFANEMAKGREAYKVDSKCVNLALRDGDKKWNNSDPKIVEDWFNDSCKRVGRHLRQVCRFMKAWRDAQWEVGGPSSISLMAATVNILDKKPHDKEDLGKTMKIVAEHLPGEFMNGVMSPDDTDDKPLFPPYHEHGARENAIIERLEKLYSILLDAEAAESKSEALCIMNTAFGNRVTEISLIISEQAAPAFKAAPNSTSNPTKISSTMVSG
ncbi:hypothetical protein LF935_02075 [Pectobacterium carotovorum]|uniref:CBASS cGAMP synthase n=1 Tax=Pectobacterium carotovorum TaxID=554 RepID=UPI001CF318AF|nr:hypothetical protein [Pectobacterium carotovorum]MCA6968410.1 hypothetical protein [Pectobacterium carotovorum]